MLIQWGVVFAANYQRSVLQADGDGPEVEPEVHQTDDVDAAPLNLSSIPLKTDFLYAYATVEGRHTTQLST